MKRYYLSPELNSLRDKNVLFDPTTCLLDKENYINGG